MTEPLKICIIGCGRVAQSHGEGALASWGVSPAMRILRVSDAASVPSKRRAFRPIPRGLQSRRSGFGFGVLRRDL